MFHHVLDDASIKIHRFHHGDPEARLPPLQPQLPTACLRPGHPGAALPRRGRPVGATSLGRSGGSAAERGAHGVTTVTVGEVMTYGGNLWKSDM